MFSISDFPSIFVGQDLQTKEQKGTTQLLFTVAVGIHITQYLSGSVGVSGTRRDHRSSRDPGPAPRWRHPSPAPQPAPASSEHICTVESLLFSVVNPE